MPNASCSICFEDLLSLPPQRADVSSSSACSSKDKEENAPAAADAQSAITDSTKGHQLVSATPCGHVFHTSCILQWIQQHRHCPQCRHQVLATNLVKLFLAEDQQSSLKRTLRHQRQYRRSCSYTDGEKVQRTSTEDEEDEVARKQQQQQEEEQRIIHDVLQCQLEDMQVEVQRLRKQLSLTEDQLQDKVVEVSGMEADLMGARQREQELERTCADTNVALLQQQEELLLSQQHRQPDSDEMTRVRTDLETLERENSELRSRVVSIGEDDRRRLADSEVRATQLEVEVRMKSNTISDLQMQLDRCNNFEIHSIYESPDEEDEHYRSRKGRRRGTRCQNLCSCLKSAFIIVCLLAFILGSVCNPSSETHICRRERKRKLNTTSVTSVIN